MNHVERELQADRTRTITWHDPMIGAEAAKGLAGLEYLLAMKRGEMLPPPFMTLIGIGMGDVEAGRVTFTLQPAEYHYNPIGSVHGGIISTLMDSAMGCAVHSLLPAGTGYTTLELKVNFLKSLTRYTGEVVCGGKAIHVGGRVATAEARLTDAAGTLYGHATTTCLILRGGRS